MIGCMAWNTTRHLEIWYGVPGAGGYREHDIVVLGPDGPENITGFPYGPEHNIVSV